MESVIRGGTVVTAAASFSADVRVAGGHITAVGQVPPQPGDHVLDAGGCLVMPGGIDPHTHLEMPAGEITTADDWYSGTAAAAAGGTTCVLDMITQERGAGLQTALAQWQERAAGKACIDYSFHMGIIDPRAEVLAELPAVVAAGVPSVKIYLAYKGRIMVNDGEAFRIMRAAAGSGALTLVHAENGEVIEVLQAEARAAGRLQPGRHGAARPPLTEAEATVRALALAEMAAAPVYIVHVTCAAALAPIRAARLAGRPVWAEACVPHLMLTDREYQQPGFAAAPYVLSPPLRPESDRRALWDGLAEGTLDLVATDHCPWHLHGHKDRGREDFTCMPNGAPGIEERLALLWTHGVAAGAWRPSEFVARTSTRAARIFGLYPQKGTVQIGADADLVVWDPAPRRALSACTQHSRVDHCLYEGMEVQGLARYVLARGRLVAGEGKPTGDAAGWGRQATRNPVP